MKKLNAFTVLSLVIFLAIGSFLPKLVLADGMMIKPDPYSDRWDYSDESEQQAFINYEDGLQKMIIRVSFTEEDSSDVLWLFPVPSKPDDVVIDIVRNMPQIRGEEVSKAAKSNLDDIRMFLQGSQIYTIPVILSFQLILYDDMSDSAMTGGSERAIALDVVVHEHIEREGLTSEIITARTADGLYNYFRSKKLNIEKGSIPVLENYIGQDYSFIASWITSPEETRATQHRGVFVTFPTKKLYYPMLPTSVYGSKVVPATIRVIGHVSPKVFRRIKSYTKTEYYVGGEVFRRAGLEDFYSGDMKNIKYTKIVSKAPSKYLVDDLWMSRFPPIKTYYSTFFAIHPIVAGAILFIIFSFLSGIIAGWISFKEFRKKILKLGLIGLSNCLTILGLIVTTIFVRTKDENENIRPLLDEIKRRGYFWRRKLSVVLLWVNLPFLIASCFYIIFEMGSYSRFFLGLVSFQKQYWLEFLMLIPIIIFIVYLIIKRIKKEDRELFKQLEANNYSSWSFKPKDGMKKLFVPLFSILFLIITWLAIKFVGFSV